jgi:predicted O-linked N-acetylglucosamine transferase (SPINDLY family)
MGHEGPPQARLEARLRRTMGATASRLRFLPRRSYAEYLKCMASADVLLDGFHFGDITRRARPSPWAGRS